MNFYHLSGPLISSHPSISFIYIGKRNNIIHHKVARIVLSLNLYLKKIPYNYYFWLINAHWWERSNSFESTIAVTDDSLKVVLFFESDPCKTSYFAMWDK
jgi:hypothetical protein